MGLPGLARNLAAPPETQNLLSHVFVGFHERVRPVADAPLDFICQVGRSSSWHLRQVYYILANFFITSLKAGEAP